jgi:hypothetical protein
MIGLFRWKIERQMRGRSKFFGAVIGFVVLHASQIYARDARFRLTLRVVDDAGSPVEAAKARIGADRRPREGESSNHGVFAEGETDRQGIFSGEVEAWDATQAGYKVEKQGYYGIWLSYVSGQPLRGKWQPWNPTIEVVLKRVKNPVPMYAKNFHGEIPVKGKNVGYDFIAGDWVAPYGKGQIADMVFYGEGDTRDNRNYSGELTVTFSNPNDGLISYKPLRDLSPLRMPYEAPSGDYKPKWIWRSVRKYDAKKMINLEYVNDCDETQNFFLRVRTNSDAAGKVVGGWYGKIHAPFGFDPRGSDPWGTTGRQYVSFSYYLNPDGSRNIEYDSKRNLLKSPKLHDRDYELAP